MSLLLFQDMPNFTRDKLRALLVLGPVFFSTAPRREANRALGKCSSVPLCTEYLLAGTRCGVCRHGEAKAKSWKIRFDLNVALREKKMEIRDEEGLVGGALL